MHKPHPNIREAPEIRQPTGERLDSWKEIARYLNRDVRTVQRWEETDGLPVYRRSRGRLKGSPVYAFTSEIDAWIRRNPPSAVEKEPGLGPASQAGRRTRLIFWAAVTLTVLLGGAVVSWRLVHLQPVVPPLRVMSLTRYPGIERYPAIAPDGKQVVFSWNGTKQDNFDLYIKFLDGGEPRRLTTHPGNDGWPAWSPDGRFVAFGRWIQGAPNIDVMIVPVLGGVERKILEFPLPFQPATYWPAGCWTPDGRWFIGPIPTDKSKPPTLGMVSVQTLEVRPLAEPVPGSAGDCCPAITQDGRRLAFLRASTGRIWNVYILSLGPDYRAMGEPKQLTAEPSGASSPMWTADGREVLYITVREGERTLWRVPHDRSGAASQLESLGPIGFFWTISPRGDRLVYGDSRSDPDIWQTDLSGEQNVARVLSSSAWDTNPEIAPDGERIAFVSDRDRGRRLWVSGRDGSNPIDLAPIMGIRPGTPRWSPDGKQIVFECQSDGNDDVCAMPAGGSAVRRLTRNPARDSAPSWSRNGKWIYFTSNRSGSFQVWKLPADGSEAGATQLTRGGGFGAVESMDGATVFFAREQLSAGIWRVAADGGEESQVGTFRILGLSCNFAVGMEGIYYGSSTDPERWFELWLYRFSNGKSERIRRIDKKLGRGMSVSPDGRWLWVTAHEGRSADLYMVENFR